MSPEAAAADHVYQRLRADILAARYAPGSGLNTYMIAKEIGMSISPVRDAMERLVGERILEVRPGGGFQIPQFTEESARDLYNWHAFLVRSAIAARTRIRGADEFAREIDRVADTDNEGLVAATAEFFYRVGEMAGNVEHLLAIRSAGDRLQALRLCERRLSRRKEELARLAVTARMGMIPAFRQAMVAYNRRRIRHLRVTLEMVYRPIEGR